MLGKDLGPYRITGTLGRGGMGEVYLARDERLGRTVAIKILPSAWAEDATRRERFLREARAASALKHPGVAHVYDVGEQEGIAYLVLEHIEGETLADRLERIRPEVDEAVALLLQVADALADAHGRGITHRDLKPSNLMITGANRVKVLDFGLARRVEESDIVLESAEATLTAETPRSDGLTRAGQLLGTVPYMSPEQAAGEEAGPPSDVFSLGVILYEMLAGRRPFQGRTAGETLAHIRAGAYPAVGTFHADLPTALVRVLDRCLETDPTRRYPTARELHADLARVPAAAGASPRDPGGSADRIESLAVLPFANGAGDDEARYLCEGMAEGLIDTLSRLPELRVLSRHATFGLDDAARDLAALGDRLGVDAVVLGDLRPRGDRIVVNVELVGLPDGRRLWGGRFDRPVAEALQVEREVVENVSSQLRDAISSDEVERLVSRPVDPQAYLLYLKAKSLLIGDAAQMQAAARALEAALARDPEYAAAHAMLTESLLIRSSHGLVDPLTAGREARIAARTASRLDPTLPEAHMARGMVAYSVDWDWQEADEAFRESLRLGGGKDAPYYEYSDYLSVMGRLDEAREMAQRARELDPVSPGPTHVEAYVCMLQGKYAEAAELFRTAIDLHPDWIWGHIKLGNTLSRMGDHAAAVAEVDHAETLLAGKGTPLARSWLGRVLGAAGQEDRARAILAHLREVGGDPLPTVYLHAVLGEREEMLAAIEEGVRQRTAMSAHLIPLALLEPDQDLFSEPRFLALLDRMGLPRS